MAKTFAIIIGIILIVVGLLGFISNKLIGADGYFLTSASLNVLYIIFGIIMLFMAPAAGKAALNTFGIIYLALAVIGFFQHGGKLFGFAVYDGADNWLHLVIGVVLLVLGLSLSGRKAAPAAPASSNPHM